MKNKMKLNENNKKLYLNAKNDKSIILKENKGMSGVYMWTNKINGKFYIGSAKDLSLRLSKYYHSNLEKKLLKSKSLIHSSILKYGHVNFSLEILEYCELNFLIEREQYFFNLLNPEYNICKIAGSSLGRKHTKLTKEKISLVLSGRKLSLEHVVKLKNRKHSLETLAKLRGRKHSSETLAKLRGRIHSPEAKIKMKISQGFATIVFNVIDNITKEFYSIRDAANNLGVSDTTVRRYIKTKELLKDIYLISKKDPLKEGRKHSSETLAKLRLIRGHKIKVLNVKDNYIKEYNSLKETSECLNINRDRIRRYINTGKLLKNTYLITKKTK